MTEFRRGRAVGAWDIVEIHLATQPYLVGQAPTIADFSLAGYAYYSDETDIDRTAFPNINVSADRLAALPGWETSIRTDTRRLTVIAGPTDQARD